MSTQTTVRPILFSGSMVRAILSGKKTQTRRVVKPQRHPYGNLLTTDEVVREVLGETCAIRCPYGQPGDRLWVRETFATGPKSHFWGSPIYRATHGAMLRPECEGFTAWKPSIHMPRWASRITLEIVSVRVERLQDISEEDAKAEGIERHNDEGATYYGPFGSGDANPIRCYRDLWESINGPGSWKRNDWVWVVEFKRIEQEESR